MKKLLLIILIGIYTINVFGQKTNKIVPETKKAGTTANPKKQLIGSIERSKKVKKVSITLESKVQNKEISSLFEYVAPNRFHFIDRLFGKVIKEAIEIAGQRYQKKDEQWIKTRKDYLPIRDQYDVNFPQIVSKPDDVVKINKLEVTLLDKDLIKEKSCQKYRYTITYDDFDNINDSGIAWINDETGLLEKVETETIGFFGPAKSVWNYNYDTDIVIEAPKNFIERDWID